MSNSSSNTRPPFCNHLLRSLLLYTHLYHKINLIPSVFWRTCGRPAPVHSPPRDIPFGEWRYGWMCVLTYPTAATLIAFDTTKVMLLLYQLSILIYFVIYGFLHPLFTWHIDQSCFYCACHATFFVQVNLHFPLEAAGRVIIWMQFIRYCFWLCFCVE